MAIDMVVQSLMRVELFAGLRPLQLAELARRSDRIVYQAGDAIITEGVAGDAAVLIVSGDAVRIVGPVPTTTIETIMPGSLLGEMAMLIDTTYTSTVIARSLTRAIRITRDAVHEQIAADSSLAGHLSEKLAHRLKDVSAQLREIDETFAAIDDAFMPAFAAASTVPEARPQLH
jgi:CRP/FNR family transcriptional regulator, cyclic AMP receptor protein